MSAGLVEPACGDCVSFFHGPHTLPAGASDRPGRKQLHCRVLHVCLETILCRVSVHSLPSMTIVIKDHGLNNLVAAADATLRAATAKQHLMLALMLSTNGRGRSHLRRAICSRTAASAANVLRQRVNWYTVTCMPRCPAEAVHRHQVLGVHQGSSRINAYLCLMQTTLI